MPMATQEPPRYDGGEYYYANKYIWFDDGGNIKELFHAYYGSTDLGFTMEGYVNSPLGEWFAKQYQYKQLGIRNDGSLDEMNPDIVKYWEAIGMKKELYNNDIKYSVFTPIYRPAGRKFPVMFVTHAGGAVPYDAEWYGFVEEGAHRGYIVVCLGWNADPLIGGSAVYTARGLRREPYNFITALEEIRKNGYPIDETRMYVGGYSGGGNAAAYIATAFPELIAVMSPATGAAIQGAGPPRSGGSTASIDDLLKPMKNLGMGMIMVTGLWDGERRWPIADTLNELGPAVTNTLEERLNNVNAWLSACGTETLTTFDNMKKHIALRGNSASSLFGLDFDREYVKNLEVPYYFGDSMNSGGNIVVRFMGISYNPHYISPSWASEVFDFCQNFSRDPVTHKLIVGQ
jgi:hypothetical protein